jgi:hypothetical protein
MLRSLGGGFFITIGAPQAHGHSLEKPGLEGSEKEGTVAELWLASPAIRLLNPFGGGAVGTRSVPPFSFAIIGGPPGRGGEQREMGTRL